MEVAGAEHSGQQQRWEVERGPKRRGCDLVEAHRGLVVVILLLAMQDESAMRERATLVSVPLSLRRGKKTTHLQASPLPPVCKQRLFP
jgi:hypothetical protein